MNIKKIIKKIIPNCIYEFIKRILLNLHLCSFYLFRVFPIHKNRIVFSSYSGKSFGDNCKYITLALLKQNRNYDLVWLVNNMDYSQFPEGVRLVHFKSMRAQYELATAKIWIDNMRKLPWVTKREGQFYIQTWHGNLGPKKCEKDAEQYLPEYYIKMAKHDSKMIDLCVSNGNHISNFYKNSFWYSGKIIECGSPRNDILIKPKEYINNAKKIIGINNEKICLYAPTFREMNRKCNCTLDYIFNINYLNLKKCLEQKFNGVWKILIRLHPNIAARSKELNLPPFVENVTDYSDGQELLSVSDCVITDFSSIVYDFIFTKRPIFIYASDYNDYIKNQRPLNFKLEDTPFKICKNNDELDKAIMNFNNCSYIKNVELFLKQFGVFENGEASKIIAEKVSQIIKL